MATRSTADNRSWCVALTDAGDQLTTGDIVFCTKQQVTIAGPAGCNDVQGDVQGEGLVRAEL